MPVIKHDPAHSKSVDQTVAKFNTTALQTVQNAKMEHGSVQFAGVPKFDKKAVDYGRPLVGTKSQARGVRGGEHVMREVMFLCEMIEQNGEGTPPDCYIKFGPLFYMYSRISETLVGMLIRARKYGLIDFEGEMLYQRQDDHKKVRLLLSSEEICRSIEYTGDPGNTIKFNNGKMLPPPVTRPQLAPNAAPPPVFSLGAPPVKQSVPPPSQPPGVPKKPTAQAAASVNQTVAAKVMPIADKTPLDNKMPKTTNKTPEGEDGTEMPQQTKAATAAELPKTTATIHSNESAATTKKMPPQGTKKLVAPPVFCLSFTAK